MVSPCACRVASGAQLIGLGQFPRRQLTGLQYDAEALLEAPPQGLRQLLEGDRSPQCVCHATGLLLQALLAGFIGALARHDRQVLGRVEMDRYRAMLHDDTAAAGLGAADDLAAAGDHVPAGRGGEAYGGQPGGLQARALATVGQAIGAWLVYECGPAADWPMAGLPQRLHLDNAAEFRSRALRLGCAQYGIELDYRPVGRPNYGGHIERMNRTLMQRLKGLPGATGNSPRGRKARKPEQRACLTLEEFERWLALEVGERYHHSEHRGLFHSTPFAAWQSLVEQRAPRQLAPGPGEAMKLLINFMPLAHRSIQADGLTIFYIRYWNPVFVVWREQRQRVRVRYHPEDLSRIFVSADGRNYVQANYADLRRPRITLWEQRAAVRALRAAHEPRVSEEHVFRAIGAQRQIVEQAERSARRARRNSKAPPATPSTELQTRDSGQPTEVDYSKPVTPYAVEIWR